MTGRSNGRIAPGTRDAVNKRKQNRLCCGALPIPKTPLGEPLRTECQHFIDSIAEDRSPRSDGPDGLRVVSVLEAGAESLARGGELIELP